VDRDVLTLARLARLLERSCTNLTLAQYRLLAMIAGGAERASELAGQLALTKPTVSATIDTLVDRSLITRETADDDRRAIRLQLTASGRDALAVAEASMRVVLDDLIGRVDDPDSVHRGLGALRDALDARRDERRAARTAARTRT
jgi:DNA-binding MarR family transcriptional regulator